MSKLAAGHDGGDPQPTEMSRREDVDERPVIVIDDEQAQVAPPHSSTTQPAAAPKMFALFQPGVRDPGTTASSSSRSSRGRAAKDKKVEYSDAKHATLGFDDDEGDVQIVGSSSAAAPAPAPKRGRPRKKAVSPAPPPSKAPSPAPLPPLSLNVKGNAPSDAPVHSFFAPKVSAPAASSSSASNAGQSATLPARATKRDQRPKRLPLWPDRDSIHVQPSGENAATIASLYAPRPIPFETIDRKGKGRAPSVAQDDSAPLPHHGLARRVQGQISGQPHSTSPTSSYHRQSSSSSAWTDQWRPLRADDVLDNEEQARYLRDWMRELEVTSANATRGQDSLADAASSGKRGAAQTKAKQPRVQTSVPKAAPRKAKRRRRGGDGGFGPGGDEVETLPSLDDFIVYDDDYIDGDDCDYAGGASRLTNCIILTGPSGAGKTAAVYACAQELNFEVFELFPGMGKRGAKELHQAVGDLARNHMVSGGGSGGGATYGSAGPSSSKGKSAFDALMKPQDVAAAATPAVASGVNGGDAADVDEDDAVHAASQSSDDVIIPAGRKRLHLKGRLAAAAKSSNTPAPSSSSPAATTGPFPTARQSLILIEEVDILFLEEDRAFWSGVIDLVASSRRPVVLTCNDVSAVPLADLPVQEVLRFQRPSKGAVQRYLGGKFESGQGVVEGALKSQSDDEGVDLRQAILQLQFNRQSASQQDGRAGDERPALLEASSKSDTAQAAPADDLVRLRDAWHNIDACSFSLAHLSQPFARHAAESVAPGVPQSLSVSGGAGDEVSSTPPPAPSRIQADGRSSSSTHRLATPEPSSESDTLLLQSYTSTRPQMARSLWAQTSAAGQGHVALPEQSSRREREVMREVQDRARSALPAQLQGDLYSINDDEEGEDLNATFAKSLHSAQQTLLNLVAPISPLWLRLARHRATTINNGGSASSPPPLPAQLVLDYAPLLRTIVRIEDAEEARMKHLASILGVGQQEAAAEAAAAAATAAAASAGQVAPAPAPTRRVLRSGHVIGGPGGWERQWTLRWHRREDYYEDEADDDEGIVDGCEMARQSGEAFKWALV